jgi:hypothetical protein
MLQTSTLLGISMVSRKNRRLFVTAIYMVVLLMLFGIVMIPWGHSRYFQPVLCSVFLLPINLSFYLFGSVVKQTVFPELRVEPTILVLTRKRHEPGEPDERDLAVRNAAYFTAYRILAAYSLLICLMLWPAFNSGDNRIPLLLILPLLVFAPTLPQAVILWTEHDVPEEART